jgi:hypothetical protein
MHTFWNSLCAPTAGGKPTASPESESRVVVMAGYFAIQ